MPDFTLEWLGKELLDSVLTASETSVDFATNSAKGVAQADAPVDQGITKAGIATETAKREGDSVVGAFGFDPSIGRRVIVEVVHPTKAGFMRRAGDSEFPKLVGKLKELLG